MSFPFAVSPARPPAIDDRLLAQLTQLAHDARQGLCSQAEAEWVLSCCGPIFEECARWRAFGAASHVTAENLDPAQNVVQLPRAPR